VAAPDNKALARAAYERLNQDLHDERRLWVKVATIAVAIFAGFVLFLWSLAPTGPQQRLEGTAVSTIQEPDDEAHIVSLVVALDDGRTVRVHMHEMIPMGARVVVNQRKTWFGGDRHGLVGLAPATTSASSLKGR
jgi:hypothetical protein